MCHLPHLCGIIFAGTIDNMYEHQVNENIKANMASRGDTARSLAASIGVSKMYTQRRLNEEYYWTTRDIRLLAEHWSMDPSELGGVSET